MAEPTNACVTFCKILLYNEKWAVR